jgi:hypothetical protein
MARDLMTGVSMTGTITTSAANLHSNLSRLVNYQRTLEKNIKDLLTTNFFRA